MSRALENYLDGLERAAANSPLEDMYLWPRTLEAPNHQPKILERCGATDWEPDNPLSRPFKVIRALKALIALKRIPPDFSLVDITCGDAIVLSELKKAFPQMCAYGLDCFKDRFETHADCYKQGIKIYKGYIQDMFRSAPPEKFDCAIMFNTYRGWESADLREHERDLPELADEYFKNNVRYTFLTGSQWQMQQLERKGFQVAALGNGESDSIMFVTASSAVVRERERERETDCLRVILFVLRHSWRARK